MLAIDTTHEEVISDFPLVKDWLDLLISNFSPSYDLSKAKFYYSYGTFVPKSQNTPEAFESQFSKTLGMLYEDRLSYELSKVRISVSIKMGNLYFSNRVPVGRIPSKVREVVSELIKIKMMMESDMYQTSVEVYKSIPELSPDTRVFGLKNDEIMDLTDEYKEVHKPQYNIDDILDKIYQDGIDSLTPEERDFLNEKSKDF